MRLAKEYTVEYTAEYTLMWIKKMYSFMSMSGADLNQQFHLGDEGLCSECCCVDSISKIFSAILIPSQAAEVIPPA